MSNPYTLWCLIQGTKIPFRVTVECANPIIDDLKNVIRENMAGKPFKHTFELWKPKEVISVKPSHSLDERVKNLGRDLSEFAGRLDEANSVAEIFQNVNQTPTIAQLDVIIEFHDQDQTTILGKRRQSDLDLNIGEDWIQFRQTWWGDPRKALADVHKHSSSGHFLHIDHEEVRQTFDLQYGDLLVRKEYLLFAERCLNMRKRTVRMGCLILGQRGIGKSLFLLFLLIDRLARQEPVLFTTYLRETYLFDADGVRIYDANYITKNVLPTTPHRIFSLVDAPEEAVPISAAVTRKTYPKTLFVASLSPNPDRYKEARKRDVVTWCMTPWSAEELNNLFKKVPFGLGSADSMATTHDENYVRDAVFIIGPCPRDIIHYIRSPEPKVKEIDQAMHSMDPSVIANALRNDDVLPHVGSHKLVLFTRVGPVATTAIIDDLYIITLKSNYIYDKMLQWTDRLNEAEREKLYSLCKGMGPMGSGLAGFLFEGFAIRHTSMCFPITTTTNNNYNPFRHFARMTRDVTKDETMSIPFVYQVKNTEWELVVRPDGSVVFEFRPSGVPPAVADGATSDTPWAPRECRWYNGIKTINVIDDSLYFCPERHNNPLFDAFFFSVEDEKVVVWILQMTTARKHNGVRGGFDLVKGLRERASVRWKQHQVEVKYVLVVPHLDAIYDVRWNFDAEFDRHEGEVYVQFLNVSTFQRDEGTIWDILGVKPEEKAMETAT